MKKILLTIVTIAMLAVPSVTFGAVAGVQNGGTGVTTIGSGLIPFGNGISPIGTNSSFLWDTNESFLNILGFAITGNADLRSGWLDANNNIFYSHYDLTSDINDDNHLQKIGVYDFNRDKYYGFISEDTGATNYVLGRQGVGTSSPDAHLTVMATSTVRTTCSGSASVVEAAGSTVYASGDTVRYHIIPYWDDPLSNRTYSSCYAETNLLTFTGPSNSKQANVTFAEVSGASGYVIKRSYNGGSYDKALIGASVYSDNGTVWSSDIDVSIISSYRPTRIGYDTTNPTYGLHTYDNAFVGGNVAIGNDLSSTQLAIVTPDTNTSGIKIRGQNGGQTANLQEWGWLASPTESYVDGSGNFSVRNITSRGQYALSGGACFANLSDVALCNTGIFGDSLSAYLLFKTSGSSKWRISNTGNFLTETDNTMDIGASGATRPRSGYFGTSLTSPVLDGGANANDDLTIQGTTNSTRTTSYVNIQPNGGNVGIGTTSPTSIITLSSDGPGVEFARPNQSGWRLQHLANSFGIQNNWALTGWVTGVLIQDALDANTMVMTSGANAGSISKVGISESSPGSKLSVKGNAGIGNSYSSIAAPTNGLIVEGNVGIGTTSPASKIDVNGKMLLEPIASTTAPTAPLTGYSGQLWNDSSQNQLTYTNGNTYSMGGNLYAATAVATLNSATPTTAFSTTKIGTTTIAANSLKVGQRFTIWGAGYYSTPLGNTATVTITPSIASSTVTNISTVTTAIFPASATNLPYDFRLNCTVQAIGASAKIVCDGTFNYATALTGVSPTSNSLSTVGQITFDSTVKETLDVKVSWSAVTTQTATVQESWIDF